jgi:hypothetical protein
MCFSNVMIWCETSSIFQKNKYNNNNTKQKKIQKKTSTRLFLSHGFIPPNEISQTSSIGQNDRRDLFLGLNPGYKIPQTRFRVIIS